MKQQRWIHIIPVAMIMYTISYVDRTNVSLALDPKISRMMSDLLMDDRLKGEAAGIFFFGYMLLQLPGGHLASRWSARKAISLFLVAWGICAAGCGMAQTFRQFAVMRFLLGMAESGVFPATVVLLANWFPRAERARANAYWTLCQPLAVAGAGPITGRLLESFGWRQMMIIEGVLPFLWLPIWWFFISDRPREAKWISTEEREYLEATLQQESVERELAVGGPLLDRLQTPTMLTLIAVYFLHCAAAYGCMTFFTSSLAGKGFSGTQYGFLFAVPYALTAVMLVINSRHSDRTGERRGHVAVAYAAGGVALILSVWCRDHYWLSYALLCLAIPGPFAAMGPLWSIPGETLPPSVMGVVVGSVNAFGNLGGFAGPYIVGWLAKASGSTGSRSTTAGFNALGAGLLLAAALSFLLPKARRQATAT